MGIAGRERYVFACVCILSVMLALLWHRYVDGSWKAQSGTPRAHRQLSHLKVSRDPELGASSAAAPAAAAVTREHKAPKESSRTVVQGGEPERTRLKVELVEFRTQINQTPIAAS